MRFTIVLSKGVGHYAPQGPKKEQEKLTVPRDDLNNINGISMSEQVFPTSHE